MATRLARLVLLGLLLGIWNTAQGQAREAEVREATSRFLAAFNNLDWPAFRACWSSASTMFGASVMFPPLPASIPPASSAKRLTGNEAEAVWRQVFDGVRQRSGRTSPPYQNIQPQDLLIEMVGDSAAIVTFHLGNDKLVSRRTLVWKQTPEGWKIVHLHASAIELRQE